MQSIQACHSVTDQPATNNTMVKLLCMIQLTVTVCIVSTGERIFDWFTPAAMYKHKLPFTVGFTAMMFIIFFYCAAEYPIFVQQFATFNPDEASVAVSDCYVNTNSTYYGPRQMEHWIRSGVSTCCATSVCAVPCPGLPCPALRLACHGFALKLCTLIDY